SFPDEVRNAKDVPNIPSEPAINQKELDTALLLVEQLTTKFEPEKYTDDYRTALMELIEDKKNGNKTDHCKRKTSCSSFECDRFNVGTPSLAG
ncbi:hypothetical protein JQK62_22310, partial [Leptospira santarosai]|nr:hypothetical protein [Leptospira santarosai]